MKQGVDRVSEQLRSPARSALRPCLLLAPGSDLYEVVPGRMTRPKRARMWITTTQTQASRLEGGERLGGQENQNAGVRPQWIAFWRRLLRESHSNPESTSSFDGKEGRTHAHVARASQGGAARQVREKLVENPQIPNATVGNFGMKGGLQ